MKDMAKIRLFYSGAMALILPWLLKDHKFCSQAHMSVVSRICPLSPVHSVCIMTLYLFTYVNKRIFIHSFTALKPPQNYKFYWIIEKQGHSMFENNSILKNWEKLSALIKLFQINWTNLADSMLSRFQAYWDNMEGPKYLSIHIGTCYSY